MLPNTTTCCLAHSGGASDAQPVLKPRTFSEPPLACPFPLHKYRALFRPLSPSCGSCRCLPPHLAALFLFCLFPSPLLPPLPRHLHFTSLACHPFFTTFPLTPRLSLPLLLIGDGFTLTGLVLGSHSLHSVTAGDGRQAVAAHEVPRAVRRWRAAVRGVAAWWSAQYDQWGCRVPWNACSENNAQDEELKRTQVRACSCTSTH